MGIKNLHTLIKSRAPDAYFRMPVFDLAGKRIAIDANGWMHANMAVARKKVVQRSDLRSGDIDRNQIQQEWFGALIQFILVWVTSGVTPIFVFDGAHPIEKVQTQSQRRNQNQVTRDKIEQLRSESSADPTMDLAALGRQLSNLKDLTREDQSQLQQVLDGIGIPWLQAVAEGEQLCSVLCIEGLVAGVWSVDTDNLAYGCPLLLTGFTGGYRFDSRGNRIRELACIRLDRIYADLDLTPPSFLDLCILAGCDYNTKLPGYTIETIYPIIREYRAIENLPGTYRTEGCNYLRCRQMFEFKLSTSLIAPSQGSRLDLVRIERDQILAQLDLVGHGDQSERLFLAYEAMPGLIEAAGSPLPFPVPLSHGLLIPASSSTPIARPMRLRIISS